MTTTMRHERSLKTGLFNAKYLNKSVVVLYHKIEWSNKKIKFAALGNIYVVWSPVIIGTRPPIHEQEPYLH